MVNSMFRIVLISSGQPSVNPRLVKEADALVSAGFEVHVIYSFWNAWAYEFDKKIFSEAQWERHLVGGSPFQNKRQYLYTKARYKAANFFLKRGISQFDIAEMSKGRAYCEMLQKAISLKADIYIAHNLAALPVAVKAAKFHKAKCSFDAEDFHRKEVTDDENSIYYKQCKYLEDKYLPHLDYMTAASPLIAVEYKKLYPQLNPITINNLFTSPELTFQNHKSKIKNQKFDLFWFSQTVGKNRGLEDVLKALSILNNSTISLHLLGNASIEIKTYLQSFSKTTDIHFYEPIPPDDIFEFASQFDIGLALEQNTPYNRDICLTNKIFTYLTSGLAVVASETSAQKQFINSYPNIGKLYPVGNAEALAQIINYYYHNKEALQKAKMESFNLAKNELNWEKESAKLEEIINTVLV